MHGELRKWPPLAQPAQKQNASHKSRYASGDRKQHGFGEQVPQDAIAAGTKSQAQGGFARTVGGPRSKQAAQVGTGGQQNQDRKQHQSGKNPPHRPAQIVAMKTPAYKAPYPLLWDSFFSDPNPRSSDRQRPATY
jgi:hypothetical protein